MLPKNGFDMKVMLPGSIRLNNMKFKGVFFQKILYCSSDPQTPKLTGLKSKACVILLIGQACVRDSGAR